MYTRNIDAFKQWVFIILIGHESDQMFEFDGSSTAVSIPNSVLDHNLPATFTIATWMRHGEHNSQDKHVKEHILCSADDHSKFSNICIFLK